MWNKDIKPYKGSLVRVYRENKESPILSYYHHGIYESDDCIYQFASPVGAEVSSETAIICTIDLKGFLKDSVLEVREYTPEEKEKVFTPDKIIENAKSHLGSNMGGYNLVTNNCEHFSNMCAFGEAKSEQVDNIMNLLGSLFGGR